MDNTAVSVMENNTSLSASTSVSVLQVTDLTYAHEQYDAFVDIFQPLLTIPEFKVRRELPLNEQCNAVFYEKTAHLKDTDFVEIDRPVLEMMGFKNIWNEKKDKHGQVKLDEYGNPKLEDTRKDFNHAIRCLRNMEGFKESSSLDDQYADFVIRKAAALQREAGSVRKGGSGLNKQEVWVRKRMLEHLVIMANTRNSRMIREYFLDLKRIMTEYTMYQMVYRSKQALSIKDTAIEELKKEMKEQSQQLKEQSHQMSAQAEQMKVQSQKLDISNQKLDMLAKILHKETDDKVLDVSTKKKKQELVVLRKKAEPTQIEVLRGQQNHVNQHLTRKHHDMEVVGKIDTYKNPINLLNRFAESIKKIRDERFEMSNNKIVLKNGSTVEDLMTVFHSLEEDKHATANDVQECL